MSTAVADPLDALMQQHGAVLAPVVESPVPAPPVPDPLDALMAEHGAQPTFRSTNEKDAAGKAVVDPNTIGTFVRHLWDTVNPVQLGQLLPWPKAAGGSGADNPLLPSNIVKAAMAVKAEGDAAWEKGDKVAAAAKYVESVLPIIGPWMSHQGNQLQQGKYAAAAGDMVGFTANAVAPKIVGAVAPAPVAPAPSPVSALTAAEADANAFAAARDIPLDAATATGSRFLRGVQKGAGESLVGAPVAERAVARQQAALTRVGGELAEQAHPGTPMTPESGGQGVRDAMSSLVQDLHKQAGVEYDKLRAAEAAPEHATEVPKAKTGAQTEAMRLDQTRTLGRVPTSAELQELRRIRAELDAYGYEDQTWTATDDFTAAGRRTSAAGGKFDIVAGHAGAPVYHDIVGSMDGAPTRAQLLAQIDHALGTGQFRSEGAKNAIEVAGRRLEGDRSLSAPILPSDASDTAPRMQSMGLAVDLRPVKQAVQATYTQLKREADLVPLQGDKAKSLIALDRIIRGPDHVPLSVADAALSDLKSMARGADPGLRTVGQGKAALAVRALDKEVQARASAGGGELATALDMGRALTKEKYKVADVLDAVKGEPVQVFRQLTAPKDSNVALLRRVRDVAPQQTQALGRAKLEDMLDLATERDRFDHVDRLYAEWQKLGAETKQILFGKDLVPQLDDFFLLAKRIGENPNPSGTTPTLLKTSEAVGLLTHPFVTLPATMAMGTLAKLLYTPKGVKALTKLLSAELPSLPKVPPVVARATRQAAQRAAWTDLASAARAAGVTEGLPKAAGPDRDSATRRTPP